MSFPHTRFDMSNRAGVLQKAETVYSSGVYPRFFGGVHVVHLFLVLHVLSMLFFLLSLLFSEVCQYLSIFLCLEYPIGISLFHSLNLFLDSFIFQQFPDV